MKSSFRWVSGGGVAIFPSAASVASVEGGQLPPVRVSWPQGFLHEI